MGRGWSAADRVLVLAWKRFKAQACPVCGVPLAVHEFDRPADYATGYLACTAAEAVAKARHDYSRSLLGQQEAAAVKNGAPSPDGWRFWIHWPAGGPDPVFEPLD